MAPGTLPKPGTKYGPCKGDCKHSDCAATRRMAAAICPDCSQPIGYDKPFYIIADNAYSHAYCTESHP